MKIGDRNLSKIFFITLGGIILSGFLFYKGLQQEAAQKALNESPPPEMGSDLFSSTPPSINNPIDLSPAEEASKTGLLDKMDMVMVEKVVDGDTIEVNLNGVKESVRFIGIDTPETVDPHRPVGCFGKEASDETKNLLTGKKVVLVKDVSDRDKYNRLLRYVYLPKESNQLLFVNYYLVSQGFAQVSTYPPDVKFKDELLKAQADARVGQKGLWGQCGK